MSDANNDDDGEYVDTRSRLQRDHAGTGYELLATSDETDTKFRCNLANSLYSWIGAAALGGFLG